MTPIEKKFITFLEKYILWLFAALIILISFFIRRQLIWYRVDGFEAYYDRHPGSVQTFTWFANYLWIERLPRIPMNTAKWISMIADFFVAIESICLGISDFREIITNKKKMAHIVFFGGWILLAPTVVLRGCGQGREDSFSMTFLLLGIILLLKCSENYNNRRGFRLLFCVIGIIACAYGIAVCPWNMWTILILFYLCMRNESKKKLILVILVLAMLINCSIGISQGSGFRECFEQLFLYMTNNPSTGGKLMNSGEWMWNIGQLIAYPFTIVGGIIMFKTEKSNCLFRCAYVITVLFFVVCMGSFMGIGDMQ